MEIPGSGKYVLISSGPDLIVNLLVSQSITYSTVHCPARKHDNVRIIFNNQELMIPFFCLPE